MTDGDRVLVWYTQYGTHVGNGFPRMAGLPVTGAEVAWTQIHILRVHGNKAVEHWAVRDDFGMLEQIRGHQTADPRRTADLDTLRDRRPGATSSRP